MWHEMWVCIWTSNIWIGLLVAGVAIVWLDSTPRVAKPLERWLGHKRFDLTQKSMNGLALALIAAALLSFLAYSSELMEQHLERVEWETLKKNLAHSPLQAQVTDMELRVQRLDTTLTELMKMVGRVHEQGCQGKPSASNQTCVAH
jgi:hypothetical protein